MRLRLERVEPYMQRCARVTFTTIDNETLPETIIIVPHTYTLSLPTIGKEVHMEIHTTQAEEGSPGPSCTLCLNTIVVQERLIKGSQYYEHCLSAGGNVSTVVLDQRLPPDTICALYIS